MGNSVFAFGPFHLDPTERVLFRDNLPVDLTPKAFDTLLVLVEQAGHVISKDALMQAVWPDTAVEENNLTQNISTLRKVLGDGLNGQRFIETVPRRGYRFVADVEQLPAHSRELLLHRRTRWSYVTEEEEEDTGQPITAAGQAGPEVSQSTATRPSARRTPVIVALAILGVIAVALGIWRLTVGRREAGRGEPFERMTMARVTSSGNVLAAAISPDGKYVVHVISDAGLESLWVKQISTGSNIQIVAPAAINYWAVTLSPDSSFVYCVTWERNKTKPVLSRVPILGGPRRTILEESGGPISLSPDGRRLAFPIERASRNESHLMLANADGTDPRILAMPPDGMIFGSYKSGPAWSPDGTAIVSAAGRTVLGNREQKLVHIGLDGHQHQIGSRTWIDVGQIAWVSDGTGLLFSAYDRPQSAEQIWFVSYPSGTASRVTNDLNDYSFVSATVDGTTLAAVQTQTVSSLWVAPASDPAAAQQVHAEVSGLTGVEGVSWTPDGNLIYRSNAGGALDLWAVDAVGDNRRQLTFEAGNNFHPAVSPDGGFLVFTSDRAGRLNLWRMNLDGSGLKQLTNGVDEVRPHLAGDGRWIVYQQGHGPTRSTIWKVAAEGGQPVQLTTIMSIRPVVSPDGRLIAYYYMDAERWGMAVMPIEGGPPVARFDIPATSGSRIVRWSPDGKALAYVDDRGGVSNIWVQPLNGGTPRQLTHFPSGGLSFFDWSRDGIQLALIRTVETRDVVRISHFRP